MEHKRVGIITQYYGSTNYGGLLQAFALCKILNEMGYDAEQIQYIHKNDAFEQILPPKMSIKRVRDAIMYRVKLLTEAKYRSHINLRNEAMAWFREEIPHTNELYDRQTIAQCNEKFDLFITGSDQVWNVDWYDPAWFLCFVHEKPKYSYAASLGTNELSDERKALFSEKLRTFSGISVRESDAIRLLTPLVGEGIRCDLDPTLLLTREQWDMVCPRDLIPLPYLFCYFLGDDAKIRCLAQEYAKKKHLKIVAFPHLGRNKRKCDNKFGDIKKYDATPLDFISLVKYAECVFTDSFHAAVFSNIYEKNFYVFGRAGSSGMSNRITTLCELFGNPERFCDSDERKTLPYLESIRDVRSDFTKLGEQREKSLAYLRGML